MNNDEGQNKEENTENYVTEKVEDKSGKDKEKHIWMKKKSRIFIGCVL